MLSKILVVGCMDGGNIIKIGNVEGEGGFFEVGGEEIFNFGHAKFEVVWHI